MRLLALALSTAALACGQAITTPANPTNTPNQINVTTSWLYANKMHFAGAWSSTATYGLEDVATYSGSTYVSLQAGNLDQIPSSSLSYWTPIGGGGGGGGTWGSITGTLSNQTDLASALAGKEPSIASGTTAQYWRGDKSWQSLSTAIYALLSGSSPITFNSSTGAFSCSTCITSNLVASVFGRTGAVTAQTGDYTPSQVGLGSVTNNAQVVDPGSNGIAVRTGATSSAARTITAGSSQISITNGNGVGGNPTIDIGTLTANTSGNAGTATALASTPSLCTTGQAPTGILANGNATGCASVGGSGFPTSTVSGIVAAAGNAYVITDGVSYCDTTTGGGSLHYAIYYDGSAWRCFARASFLIGRIASGSNATVGSSSTVYVVPAGAMGNGAAETNNQISLPFAVVATQIHTVTVATQSATGALTCALRFSSTNQALSLSVTAGGGAGSYSDGSNTSHYTLIPANTLFDVACTNAATATSAGFTQMDIAYFAGN